MPKQNNNAGSGTDGPHKQGEKGGKGGTYKGAASSGGKSHTSQGEPGTESTAMEGRTPKVGISKINESGKGSGDR